MFTIICNLNFLFYWIIQVKANSESRRYSLSYGIGVGNHTVTRNGRLTGNAIGGVAVVIRVSYDEKDYAARVKTTVGEAAGINVDGVRADLTDIKRDGNKRVEIKG